MRYTIAAYAAKEGISRAAVYKKLDTSLRAYVVREGRQLFLDIPEGAESVNHVNPNLSTLSTHKVDNSTPIQPSVNPSSGESVNLSTHCQPSRYTDLSTLSTPPGEAAGGPERPSDGGENGGSINTPPDESPSLRARIAGLEAELEQVTRERDELRREAASREQLIAAKEETLRTMQAQVGDLQAEVARLREDLDRERAAHQDDRQRDRETLEQALREAHARQHELSVLLLQEQNRHKPLRLLLAEKAESIFHKTKRKESANHDENE